jgi:hypothetical protein
VQYRRDVLQPNFDIWAFTDLLRARLVPDLLVRVCDRVRVIVVTIGCSQTAMANSDLSTLRLLCTENVRVESELVVSLELSSSSCSNLMCFSPLQLSVKGSVTRSSVC